MIFLKRKRSEILNKLADVIMELDDVREQLKQARETSSYWFEHCKELEASENVQGVPFVATPAEEKKGGRTGESL